MHRGRNCLIKIQAVNGLQYRETTVTPTFAGGADGQKTEWKGHHMSLNGTELEPDNKENVNDPTEDQGQGNGDQNAGGKQINMEEAERIAAERAERASRAAMTSYFQQEGMSEAEAKQAFDMFRKQREENDLAARNDLTQLQARLQQVEQERELYVQHANMQRVRAEAMLQALNMSIRPDRVDHVIRLADLAAISIDDRGEPDKNAVRGALEAVVSSTPEFKVSADNERTQGFKMGASNQGNQDNIKGQLDQIFELE